jgi:hypothetical protein
MVAMGEWVFFRREKLAEKNSKARDIVVITK